MTGLYYKIKRHSSSS